MPYTIHNQRVADSVAALIEAVAGAPAPSPLPATIEYVTSRVGSDRPITHRTLADAQDDAKERGAGAYIVKRTITEERI